MLEGNNDTYFFAFKPPLNASEMEGLFLNRLRHEYLAAAGIANLPNNQKMLAVNQLRETIRNCCRYLEALLIEKKELSQQNVDEILCKHGDDFHSSIAELSMLSAEQKHLLRKTKEEFLLAFPKSDSIDRPLCVLHEHLSIVDAIEKGSSNDIVWCIQNHIATSFAEHSPDYQKILHRINSDRAII